MIITIFLLLVLPLGAAAADGNSKAGQVSVSSTLNVRSSPSTSGIKVASLKNNTYITLLSQSGSWWKVEYGKGMYGYCHADYIRTVNGSVASVNTQSGSLNVRSGPGTAYGKTGSLAKGEYVLVLSSSGGWSKILYAGTKTGYVSAQYLSSVSSGYPAVSLWVPNLKQKDERWAEVTIGTSGKTIGQIGCATTAVAMLESHRTGKTIYPDVMAAQLRYTASGNLYWPSHYTVVTSGTQYLSKIYQLLKAGKPVLFGARNAYGSQHWVVITGFMGGSSLTASHFTIQDPGSNSRTNLQQFLNQYPTFYKYFHY